VRPFTVAIPAPGLENDAGVRQRAEQRLIQQLVSQFEMLLHLQSGARHKKSMAGT
jgi:hypothetical protein